MWSLLRKLEVGFLLRLTFSFLLPWISQALMHSDYTETIVFKLDGARSLSDLWFSRGRQKAVGRIAGSFQLLGGTMGWSETTQ